MVITCAWCLTDDPRNGEPATLWTGRWTLQWRGSTNFSLWFTVCSWHTTGWWSTFLGPKQLMDPFLACSASCLCFPFRREQDPQLCWESGSGRLPLRFVDFFDFLWMQCFWYEIRRGSFWGRGGLRWRVWRYNMSFNTKTDWPSDECGIYWQKPKSVPKGADWVYKETVLLGHTTKSREEVRFGLAVWLASFLFCELLRSSTQGCFPTWGWTLAFVFSINLFPAVHQSFTSDSFFSF